VIVTSAVLVTAVAASAVTIGGPAGGAGRSRPGVPVPAATVAPALPAVPVTVPAAVAPLPCGSSALSLSTPTVQLATATALVSAVARNVSSGTCTLDQAAVGAVVAEALGLGGAVPGGTSVSGLTAPQLAPGASVPLQLTLPVPTGAGGSCTVSVAPSSPLGPLSVELPVPCAATPPSGLPAVPGVNVPAVPAPSLAGVPTLPPPPPLPSLPSVPGVPSLPAPSVPAVPGLPGVPSLPAPSLSGLSSLLPGAPAPASPAPTQPPAPAPPPARYSSGASGYDISWPQCGSSYPPSSPIGVVGVNDGRGFTTNPCLSSEAAWAGNGLDLYVNINSPSAADGTDSSGPAGNCGGNTSCMAYNYGYNDAQYSMSVARNQGLAPRMWWLDVETVGGCAQSYPTGGSGYWSCNQGLNRLTIQGALDAIRSAGSQVGVYSTSYQWGVITANYTPSNGSPPNWLAGDEASPPSAWCDGSQDFAGGAPWLLQVWPTQTYDRDQAC
jgi:hypothetical protein